ncbi:uncharacterized protein MONBRDRAFT_5578 [Monosiga brevicollis MX1]|uniref:ceramidase n=1 Tax=Monosiga brevicollis TaxID=81824 RepID=A9URV2_MONBE|nr:uncharacterized protein MONBRDRAFT_5578 [Monosiga brevicollis MX1]EDQ91670.1 predicted protein [Monosiga brevicollis MX1]|eukprot:XP_001742956.1 hypothetical protein [Monosiga brevicollis MX1]
MMGRAELWLVVVVVGVLTCGGTGLAGRGGVMAAPMTPPTVQIEWEAPVASRWAPAVDAVLARYSAEESFLPVFAAHNASLFNNLTTEDFATLGQSLANHWPHLSEEVDAIAQILTDRGIPTSFNYLAAWVWFHELAHTDAAAPDLRRARACTGVLVPCGATGIAHARNMDQSPYEARRLTLHINMTRNGQVLFEGVDWYWITGGLMTAAGSGLTLEENWRFTDVFSKTTVLAAATTGAMPQVFVFRHVLTQAAESGNASAVLETLETLPLVVGMYIIASAPEREGVIISRSALEGNITRLSGDYLVQTNYDHWLPDPADDPRRTMAEQRLNSTASSLNDCHLSAYDAVVADGVKNTDTAYSVLMTREGIRFAIVWDTKP